jgi:thiamine biosynthesis lipoprotein ApbE
MRADALATAINAMGATKGLTFANNKNIDAIFLLKEEENYIVKFSESFKKTLQ